MSSEQLKRLSMARTALVLDHPFFGALALKLDPKESPRTNTMATDGRSLFYSAAFVDGVSDAELVGLYAHEVLHPAMQHHARREGRDPSLWNEAADYAINPLIVEAGMTIPEDGLIDPQYAGMSAEQIYSRLEQQQKEEQQRDKEQQGDDAGGSGNDQGQGQPQPGKSKPDPADIPGAVFDAPDPSADAAEWQVAVNQAIKAASMMGRLPAGMKAQIEEQLAPKVDWRSILRRFAQQVSMADYSWRMPNRRYMAGGLYLPELRSETMGPMAVYLDTSGSTRSFLAMFAAEISAIADELQPECVYVVHCDAQVHHVDKFERGDTVVIEPQGGGGTSFEPPFEWAEEQQIQPACAVYLTDGEGRFPDQAPDYPVLWAMTGDIVAPWGESMKIEENHI